MAHFQLDTGLTTASQINKREAAVCGGAIVGWVAVNVHGQHAVASARSAVHKSV